MYFECLLSGYNLLSFLQYFKHNYLYNISYKFIYIKSTNLKKSEDGPQIRA